MDNQEQQQREKYLERQRRYNSSEKGRARHARYNESEKGETRRLRYEESAHGMDTRYSYEVHVRYAIRWRSSFGGRLQRLRDEVDAFAALSRETERELGIALPPFTTTSKALDPETIARRQARYDEYIVSAHCRLADARSTRWTA